MNSKRMILATVLSVVVMIIFFGVYYFTTKGKNDPETATSTETTAATQSTNEEAGETNTEATVANPTGATASSTGAIAPATDAVDFFENTNEIAPTAVVLENEHVRAVFSNENAVLTSYRLKAYSNRTYNEKGEILETKDVEMVENTYFGVYYPFYLRFYDLASSFKHGDVTHYRVEKKTDTSVSFAGIKEFGGNRILVTKTFSLTTNAYEIQTKIEFANLSTNSDIRNFAYSLFMGSGIGPYPQKEFRMRDDVIKITYLETGKKERSELLKEGLFNKPEAQGPNRFKYEENAEQKVWLAMENRYFAFFLSTHPANAGTCRAQTATWKANTFTNENAPEDHHLAGYYREGVEIPKGKMIVENYYSFMGPKRRDILSTFKGRWYEHIFHEKFFGFLNIHVIVNAMYWLMQYLFKFTGHYAYAILLITFIYKLITFPLTQKSYDSMKKMQMLQPKVEQIRTQHKNNSEKMNQELMNLYKKEKINPLGGCLPMLLPFPILIAFFYLMQSMVELRYVSFLWIADLTAPDRLFTIGTFHVNLLPVLMTITTYFSMALQPKTGTGEQANQMQMFNKVFPLVFLFILYNFASGLVLYWTSMNILNLVQQWLTNKFKKEELVTVVNGKAAKKKK